MAQRMHIEHHFDCSPEALYDLLTDEEFDDKLMEAIEVDKTVLEKEQLDNGVRYRLKMSPKTDLPGFMQKVVGGNQAYDEVRTWDREKLGNTWEIEPGFASSKVNIKGTLRITPDGDGCKRMIDGDFSVKIPLVGKKIESFIIKQTEDSFERNAKFVRQYIKEHDIE